jgi:glucose-1-phosphate cytidylyltransferase
VSEINQVVILAGGKGTRMREMTEDLPKPMVPIGGMPVLDHLIKIFSSQGKFQFIICTGYLGEKISKHYENRSNVKVVFTGDETETGGRLFSIKNMLGENFFLTYGDGLANININKLISIHKKHKKIGTITVTNPTSRFGLIEFDNNFKVNKFIEKPKLEGFINIGFMVFNNKVFKYLDKNSVLESSPLKNLSNDSELYANIHQGYFEPMDTYREYLNMNKLWDKGVAPWKDV